MDRSPAEKETFWAVRLFLREEHVARSCFDHVASPVKVVSGKSVLFALAGGRAARRPVQPAFIEAMLDFVE